MMLRVWLGLKFAGKLNDRIGGLGFFNRNTATSVVFIDILAFPIRNAGGLSLALRHAGKEKGEQAGDVADLESCV
jgi:hypothetical protein